MGAHQKTALNTMIFVDSNIWCYYFDQRLSEHKHVLEPMREIIKSEEIICNTFVMAEVAHYLVRNFRAESCRKKIDLMLNLSNLTVTSVDRQLLNNSFQYLLDYGYEYGLGGRDSTILATLTSEHIKKIISHDNIFKRVATEFSFKVIDPIPTP
jgi:predicted nucleic acid-binding protein